MRMRTLRYRLRALLRRRELDREMDEEMRFHVDMVAREYEAAGLSPREARRRALIDFGGMEKKREETRDARGLRWIEDLAQDIRYGFRVLRRNPVFTAVAVVSLGLGIGANTAVFSLVNAVLLRSLPVPDPHQLRLVEWTSLNEPAPITINGRVSSERGQRMQVGDVVSYPAFSAVRERSAGQAEVFGFGRLSQVNARYQGDASLADGLMVSGNFFQGLGVGAARGRVFSSSDPLSESGRWVVVSHRWWTARFGGAPNLLGQGISLNGHPFTVIGVLPPGIRGLYEGDAVDFYVSVGAQPELAPSRSLGAENQFWVAMMARLRPGVSDEQFQAQANAAFVGAVGDRLTEASLLFADGRGGLRGGERLYRRPLLLLLGIVGLVILAACVNLAGLSLARAAAREHEFRVRPALGAGRGRLLRQSLTESLLLGALGAGAGLVLAVPGKDALARLLLDSRGAGSLSYDATLDGRVLAFTLALAWGASVVAGLVPALRLARTDGIPGTPNRQAHGRRHQRLARTLIVGQMALSIVLLVGAGLYARTLINLRHIETGFRTEDLLLFRLDPRSAGVPEGAETDFYDDVVASLERVPGVRSAAVAQFALLSGWMSGGGFFTLPDHPTSEDDPPQAHRMVVSEAYFATMAIPLVQGRGFQRTDDERATRVVVVNQTFARRYFPEARALGERLRVRDEDWTVVGVSRDALYTGLTDDLPPTVYFSVRQSPLPAAFFHVHTDVPPLTLLEPVRRAVAEVNRDVPLARISTQDMLIEGRLGQERLFTFLLGTLSSLAVLLSCVGLYGLMAYDVARRTGEIGVRVALGATRRQIVAPMLREAVLLTGVGASVGTLAVVALVRLIRGQLYGVGPYDPWSLAAGPLLMLIVAVLAVGVPARRASGIDPADALRGE